MKVELLTPNSTTQFELYNSEIVITIQSKSYANVHYSVLDDNVLAIIVEPINSPKND